MVLSSRMWEQMTEPEIHAALTERDVLSLTLWGEARGEPVEGIVAVAQVIATRTNRRRQPIKAVCLAPKQFSCWNPGMDANHVALMALAESLVDTDHVERPTLDAAFLQCRWIADGILAGVVRDNTRASDHYLVTSLFESSKCPTWAKSMQVTTALGNHTFLRG